MNRRHSDRISDDHDISKQRIVRQKIHRSPSPPLSRHSHREVRTSNSGGGGGGDMYSKMSNSSGHRSHKFGMDFRHSSSTDFRDDHLGRNKDRRYGRDREDLDNDGGDSRGGRRRSRTSDVSIRDTPPIPPFFDNYKYSLHVANISSKLTEGEAKMQLFRDFKRFGFVNIKVIGFGKDRHAFINFTKEDEARDALHEMHRSIFFGESLEVTWSRATLNQHPELLAESQGGGDRRPSSKGHGYHSSGGGGGVGSSPIEFYPQGGRGSYHRDSSPHQSIPRDISYLNISPEPSPRSSSGRNHSLHSSKDIPAAKSSSGPITDPNATRTLFVGNLEADVTERELRDLFGPYGRIESVDIKVQRPISTAYAFVKFFTITDAMNAKKDMHGRKYGNVKLKIGFGKGSPSAKVWIGNLSSRADLSEIRGELDRFGLIRRIDYTDGDNHAFVHFDSLDAAQTAVDSLTTYRFRNTNRPLKIDVSQPVRHSPGSDYEDFEEPDYHNSVMSGNGSRRVHSHMSPEPSALSPIRRNRVEMGGGGEGFSRHLSRSDDNMDLMLSSMKGSFRTSSSRGRRVVTEVRDGSHARQSSFDDSFSQRDAGGFRKRTRSPNFGDDLDSVTDFSNRGFRGRRRSRGSMVSNGSQRMGHSNNNGDFDYRAKRPRNGFDAYQYHKLHGTRASFDNSNAGNFSSGYDRDRDRDRSHERDRDNRGSRRSSRDRASSNRRSSSLRRDQRTRSDDRDQDRDRDREGQRSQKGSVSSNNAEPKAEIEKISPPPPPPPPPPMTDMMSYEAADSALKLNDSSGQASTTDGAPGHGGLDADSKVETLADMSRVYPVIWRGNLVLKNTGFPTRMHLVGGDPAVAELLVKSKEPGNEESDALRITQRLRLDPPRLDEVNKRMASAGHCILLALPGAIPSLDEEGQASNSATQLRPLKSLVSYLEQKEAAGIVALNGSETGVAPQGGGASQPKESIIGVLHAFPPCDFSHNQLRKIAPNLGEEPSKEDHVVVLLVKGTV